MEDIFAIQDEISLAIVDKLKVKLLGDEKEKLVKRHTVNQDAYNLYLKGRYFWNKRYEGLLQRAIECFEQAIEEDPSYALAYSGLADSYSALGLYSFLPPREACSKAKAAAEKAIEIDDTIAEAHVSMGLIKSWFESDWAETEREAKRAIELNSRFAMAYGWYGNLLALLGRVDEGIECARRCQQLDPLSPHINSLAGYTFYNAHQYDQAIEQFDKAFELEPNYFVALWMIALPYREKMIYEKAVKTLQQGVTQSQRSPFFLALLGHTYGVSGQRKEAQTILEELTVRSKQHYMDPLFLAWVYTGLAEIDQAFKCLDKACEERFIWIVNPMDSSFNNLHSDPRFPELLKKTGLRKW
jgi:tetratricopeptide (TPR) repeat protein